MEEALTHLHKLIGLDDYWVMVVFHETAQTTLLALIAIHMLFARRGAKEPTKERSTPPPDKPKPTNEERIAKMDEILRKKKPKQL